LLLAMFNALQPGVFALSGWDLAGMLTVDPAQVADLIADGDTRWINRGAHDLRGVDEPAHDGMPAAPSLYGTLPEQLADPSSFASRLRSIIAVRRRYDIATAVQVDIPDVAHRSQLVMIHRLADESLQITVLNFGGETIAGSVRSEHLPPGAAVMDMFTGEEIGTVDDLHSFMLVLAPYRGTSLRVS
jgi:maltose alpha-D-glucosyltransferase/alpha-amylase